MFRLCARNTFLCNKNIIQPILREDVKCNLKVLSALNNLTRYYASESNAQKKLECVYNGPLTSQIKGVKVFSLSSSMAGLVAQPIIIREAANIGSTSLIVALCSVVGFFTFVTPLLLHIITKKYVTEIHYDADTNTYKATTINFFMYPKQIEFTPDDVIVPDIPGMFTTMKAKGVPLFIEARHFHDPFHYAKIMGYDKPMDFKLGEIDNEEHCSTNTKK